MKFEKFSKYALLVLTSLSLLATLWVSKELLFPYITTKAFYFRIVLEMGMAFYVYLIFSRRDLRPDFRNPLNIFVMVFLAINFLSAVLGVNVTRSVWGNFERMGGAFYLAHLCLLYFYVLCLGQMGGRYMRIFLKGLLIVAAIVTLNGISGVLGWGTLVMDPSLPLRASSTFGNPIFFASFLIFPLFLSVFFALQAEKRTGKIVFSILAFLQLVGIVQSGTRGAVVGLALGIFIAAAAYIVLGTGRKLKLYGSLGILIFVATVGLLFAFHEKLPQGTTLARVFNLRDSNTQSRLIQWRIAIKGVKDFPLLGVGPENYYLVGNKYYNNELYAYDRSWFDKPHNFLLEILVTTGILGFTAYAGILLTAGWILWRVFKAGILSWLEACLFFAAVLAYQIQNLFVFDTIPASLMFYSFLGFVSYLHYEANYKKQPKTRDVNARDRLPQRFAGVASVIAAAGAVYLILITNIMPARASKSVNYGYAYASIDPYKAAEYFKTATSLPFNFDLSETASKYTDFATGLMRANFMAQDAAFVERQLIAAKQFQTNAVLSAPNDPVVLQKYATILLYDSVFHKQAIPLEAISAAQKAIDLAPKRVESRLSLAQLRLYQGFPAEAAKLAEEAVALDPKNKDNKWQLALVYEDAGRAEEAVKTARELLDSGYEPSNPADLLWLIDFYVHKGEGAEAIKFAEKLVFLAPASPDASFKLYSLYMKYGKKEDAEKFLEYFKANQKPSWPALEKLLNPQVPASK